MKSKLLALFFLIGLGATAQTLVLNQSKYWDYRQVLKKHYVSIGEGKGKSIPAEYYNPKKGRLHWGDGTMALGWYIGVLATEYHLSSKKAYLETGEGKAIDPKQTLIELSYALLALERLDRSAEPFFDENAEGELNGFLIRDDVGKETLAKFPRAKYLDSDFTHDDPFSNEMSQDQVYEIMIGLALVKSYIPEKTQVGGLFLHQMAIDQANRILNQLAEDNWRLRNPVVQNKNGKKGKKVLRGHQPYIFSEGTKKMMEFFGSEPAKNSLFYDFYWYTLRSGANPVYSENNNSFMAMSIAAVGNGFKKNTYRKLVKRTKKNEWYIYPLLNKALYPVNREIDYPILELSQDLINSAPSGGVKSNFGTTAEHSWGVNNRFFKFSKYQKEGIHYQVDRQYNGLDFMLFYNLWLINRTGYYKDSWKLLAPRTRKEKRKIRKAKKAMENEVIIEE